MPRRRVAERRAVLPDPVYNNALVTKFINGIMWGGKRSIAERTFYAALAQVGEPLSRQRLGRWGNRTGFDTHLVLPVVAEWQQGHYQKCLGQQESPRRRDTRERAFVMKKC